MRGRGRVTHHASQCTVPCVRFLSLLSSIPGRTNDDHPPTDPGCLHALYLSEVLEFRLVPEEPSKTAFVHMHAA